MNHKYKKLISNSLVFAIGNFGSKIMSFIMVPIYSYTLSTKDFGKVDLLTSLVSLLLPVLCLDIFDSVFRFALDEHEDKVKIFSTGAIFSALCSVFILIIGFVLSLFIKDYPIVYTSIYMIITMMFSLVSNFSRAIGYVKQFAVAGIINTIVMGLSNILLLVVIRMGMNGYMLSMIVGQAVATIFLIFSTNIKKYFKNNEFSQKSFREMMVYGVPLIPNTLAWWLNSASDRFFILGMLGASANGVYAMASKVPGIVTTINTIFFQSWQMSVVEEYDKKDGDKFITSVFESYLSALFFIGIGILAIIRPLYRVILSPDYFIGWKLTPWLVLAVIYTSVASFLGTIYTASKRTTSVLVTTIIGAIANVLLTIVLIKLMGVDGAAIANSLSFFLVSALRFHEIQTSGKISLNFVTFILLHVLFGISAIVLLTIQNDIVVFVVIVVILVIQFTLDSSLRNMFQSVVGDVSKRFSKR